MKHLCDLPAPQENKPDTVKQFFEHIQGLHATLVSAEATEYLCSPQTMETAVNKLPPNMVRSWLMFKKKISGKASLHNFIDWLEPYYDCAIVTDPIKPESNRRVVSRANVHNEVKTSNIPKESTKSCPFCRNADHTVAHCKKFEKALMRVRWQFVRRKGFCFNCLEKKHNFKNCDGDKSCSVKGCSEKYHRLLHRCNDGRESEPPVKEADSPIESSSVNFNTKGAIFKTYYRVLPVKLSNPATKASIMTWAFLDEGSSPTMMSSDIASKLQINGETDELCTSWTNGVVNKDPSSQRISVQIAGVSMKKSYILNNVRTVVNLNLPTPSFDMQALKRSNPHLKDVFMPEIPFSQPGILIGLEHPKMGVMLEIREGSWNQIIASKTRLGWALHGKDGSASVNNDYTCTVCECGDYDLHEAVRDFFTTESFGVKVLKPLESKEDERARDILCKTTRRIDSRYETGLLWCSEAVQLPENYVLALRRLKCFEMKLNRDPKLKAAVLEKLDSHFKQGYLKKLSVEEMKTLDQRRHWYLPLFVITNPNKVGKIRLVFDAAAKFDGISLNDVLLKGPDQLTSLYGVLLRFRERKIALTADIMEMFHRVKIVEDDQYCQLVLWRECDPTKQPMVYKMTVMTFGSTCSPCSAQYVKNTNAIEFEAEYPRAVEAILKRHYVDEVLDSFDSSEEALQVAMDIRMIHKQGGFAIRDWVSNDPTIAAKMNNKENTTTVVGIGANEEGIQRVLGLFWNTISDEFNFQLCFKKFEPAIIEKKKVPTKREILRLVMSIFDPLGFMTIITVSAKILLSEIWRNKIMWDQTISEELVVYWQYWLDGLCLAAEQHIPRCLTLNCVIIGRSEVHIFCDSSEAAFASVAYLVVEERESSKKHVSFITAKARVAPQKVLSIPRLELQGCLMGARLLQSLKQELSLEIDDWILWSDSKTALGWIRSVKRKYSTFVSHRIGEILDVTTIPQWRWIPGKLNVADDATRGFTIPTIPKRWFHGPDFLLGDANQWPTEENRTTETDEEAKLTVGVVKDQLNPYYFIQVNRFSKWERLLRAVAYVIKFTVNVKMKCEAKKRNMSLRFRSSRPTVVENLSIPDQIRQSPALTASMLNQAETVLIKLMQFEEYKEDLRRLEKGLSVSKQSKTFNLNPYLDKDGVIRLSGRIDAAPAFVPDDMKRPILLSSSHCITYLVSEKVHRQFHHRSKESVINYIRERFWIPKIRVHVNTMIRNCNMCKVLKAKPAVPKMAELPQQRIAPNQPAFTFTGLDFFGPIEVTIGRRREKRWGVIFTCLSSRAIHLELAHTLDTSSAIMAIRNFVNRRGTPVEFMSDNGTNLKSAEKELRLAMQKLDYTRIQDETTSEVIGESRVKWTFIPPAAPHYGGAWERMISTVKTILYMILRSKAPREETLRSALIEVENLVNSRPLFYSSEDINNPSVITPNMLLRNSSREVSALPSEFDCRKQWVISQAIADEFWSKWLRAYLPTIAIRRKWYSEKDPIKVGQLVLIIDENTRRGDWRKAIVSKVFPSRDGRIRSAEVRTSKGVYVRPVAKLAVISDLGVQF